MVARLTLAESEWFFDCARTDNIDILNFRSFYFQVLGT